MKIRLKIRLLRQFFLVLMVCLVLPIKGMSTDFKDLHNSYSTICSFLGSSNDFKALLSTDKEDNMKNFIRDYCMQQEHIYSTG